MGFFKITEQILNNAFTENGDQAYSTTGSKCLDYFSLIGGMRYNIKNALNLFIKAYFEDPIIAIKLLFYVRDVRNGLGERSIFRYTLNALGNMYPFVCKQLIKYVPEFGRYDDLLILLDTNIQDEVIEFIKVQLDKDIENKKKNKPISLLAKWLPSINTSSLESREYARKIAFKLRMKQCEYRKVLSFLRKDLIIENNLREEDFTFNYQELPGGAFIKYRNVFLGKDKERFSKYLYNTKKGDVKINTKFLYPYEVIRNLSRISNEDDKETLDLIWNKFDRNNIDSKTIVVRDGSGSMLDGNSVTANDVATSLTILFAEQLTGEFKNKFITFSSRPKLVTIEGNTIYDKYKFISSFDDYTNTNIEKVYNLILSVYRNKNFKKEDALERIVIISDMEFDQGVDIKESTFDNFKKLFKQCGFELPEVVFWNVRARDVHFPTVNEYGIKLVSGASGKLISAITSNESINPYDFMIECLEKYSCFDSVKVK